MILVLGVADRLSFRGLDPMERLDGPGVAGMAAFWAERCAPSTAWAGLTQIDA